MNNKVGDLWNRIFEMSERLMDADLTEEELRNELARMDGLYKASKSVIDMTNAVTRMRVMEKTEGISLPGMFTDMGESPTPIPACMPDVPVETGRRPPLLSRNGGVAHGRISQVYLGGKALHQRDSRRATLRRSCEDV